MRHEYPLSGKEALKAIKKGEVIQDKSELNFYRFNRSLLFFSKPLNVWVKTNVDLEDFFTLDKQVMVYDSDMYRIVPTSEIIQLGITL